MDTGALRATLDDIRRIIGVDAKPVAEVLPEAFAQATEQRESALAAALEPVMTRSIRTVAARESQWFGEILAPTIGAAVRKAVAEAFAVLMQRFNEALERSLSLRSLQWRLEARRTGRPFAEVVLLRTLVYRVEQVFLIHGESGLVLQHVAAEGVASNQPDQVASMLSAIDTFGREAFAPTSSGAYLHEFALGDLTVWVDRGGAVAIAVVIRGRAPRSLLEAVAETRERILLEQSKNLEGFVADTTPFVEARPLLEQCLQEQRTEAPQRGPIVLGLMALVVFLALGGWFAREHRQALLREQQLATYRELLAAEPGIVITGAREQDGRFHFEGLRDPIAPTPAELSSRLGLPPAALAFEPFYSLDARVIERRFRRLAQPPPEVSVQVSAGTLRLTGAAPRSWIQRALVLAPSLPGVERVEPALIDSTERALVDERQALEALQIGFQPGSTRLDPPVLPLLRRAAQGITRVWTLSRELGLASCIVVIGDADASGGPRVNARLAAERARQVRAAVRELEPGLSEAALQARARREGDERPPARSVRFAVRAPCAAGAAP